MRCGGYTANNSVDHIRKNGSQISGFQRGQNCRFRGFADCHGGAVGHRQKESDGGKVGNCSGGGVAVDRDNSAVSPGFFVRPGGYNIDSDMLRLNGADTGVKFDYRGHGSGIGDGEGIGRHGAQVDVRAIGAGINQCIEIGDSPFDIARCVDCSDILPRRGAVSRLVLDDDARQRVSRAIRDLDGQFDAQRIGKDCAIGAWGAAFERVIQIAVFIAIANGDIGDNRLIGIGRNNIHADRCGVRRQIADIIHANSAQTVFADDERGAVVRAADNQLIRV